jgi:hypothetical protein
LGGVWFYAGDPNAPCSAQVLPARGGKARFLLTNERGERSEGCLGGWGTGIIAEDWGGLFGEIRGGAIYWRNGTVWTR